MAKKYHSTIVENKLKEERTEKCADNNRHKKKKKKSSKNNQQQFFKTDKLCEKNLQAGSKDKKELKNLEFKNEVIYDNFQNADVVLRKNKKPHNQIDGKHSGSTDLRKPSCVYKRRDRSKNYDFLCYSNRFNHLLKDHHSVELCNNNDLKKNDQNNRKLTNQKSNDRPEKSVRVVTPSKYVEKDSAGQRSNSVFFTTQNNTEQLYDREMNCHAIKTMIINRGTKYTKSLHGQYTAANNFIENPKITNNSNFHDKYNNWGFYSHNGQNTYSIENGTLNKNKAETPSRNKHIIKNIKPIVESFHKSKYEKSLFYVGSDYNINQGTEKNQKLNSDVMDINLHCPLSDSTFINTKNPQDNNKQHKKVSTSQSKIVPQTCNIQNFSNTIDNNSPSFFYNQNQLEEDKYNPRKYYVKCMETINSYYSEENVNLTNKNNLDKKKKVKYYDDESNDNNYNDIKSIQINNLDNFTAYFDKVWEAVMQEISGY